MKSKVQITTMDKIQGLALAATDELLTLVDELVDRYRATFFSGDDPQDVAEKLGELASTFVKLADVGLALSSVTDSAAQYEDLAKKLATLERERAVAAMPLRVVDTHYTEDGGELTT